MQNKSRYVFDTNTIISAFLFDQSNPGLALQEALERGELLLSIEVLEEIAEVLRRKKFDRYVRRKTREQFLRALIQKAVFVEVNETIHVCRDPKDDKFLELAISGNAFKLITGDEDLLCLNPFRNISILTPKQFLSNL
ncbi:MAG: putative toxin-antitoxin system toxin component, PIN family [bacterium]